jgi:hypothetical protein
MKPPKISFDSFLEPFQTPEGHILVQNTVDRKWPFGVSIGYLPDGTFDSLRIYLFDGSNITLNIKVNEPS